MISALGENLEAYIVSRFGTDYLKKYSEYIRQDYNSYLRISCFHDENEVVERLSKYGIRLDKIPNLGRAYRIIESAGKTGKTLEFCLGRYYIQSLSSMIPPMVLNPSPGSRTLDLCAAPGSKTTLLGELMQGKGTLIANEPALPRVKSLVYNIDRFCLTNCGILKAKGELLSKEFPEYFDYILVDAPCSGSGIVQKKGEVASWWNLAQVEKLSELQTRLLVSATKMLKPGGELLYSTCSIAQEENELVVSRVLKNYNLSLMDITLAVPSEEGILDFQGRRFDAEIKKCRRIVPWDSKSEGFFLAKFKKPGLFERKEERVPKGSKLFGFKDRRIYSYLTGLSSEFGIPMEEFGRYLFHTNGKDFYFVDRDYSAQDSVNYIRQGAKFGVTDSRGGISLHSQAGRLIGGGSESRIELSDESEIKTYLSGGVIKKEIFPKGQKIVEAAGMILGCAVAGKDGIKSRFPRSMRTSEILLH